MLFSIIAVMHSVIFFSSLSAGIKNEIEVIGVSAKFYIAYGANYLGHLLGGGLSLIAICIRVLLHLVFYRLNSAVYDLVTLVVVVIAAHKWVLDCWSNW